MHLCIASSLEASCFLLCEIPVTYVLIFVLIQQTVATKELCKIERTINWY
uniref:Uncharacterized protein n=1 Tax=Anguilla anguilla TaxID=7936 RepID=A0A0E9S567_ANGAN